MAARRASSARGGPLEGLDGPHVAHHDHEGVHEGVLGQAEQPAPAPAQAPDGRIGERGVGALGKVRAKTVTKLLSDDLVEDYRSWLDAAHRLHELLRELETLSVAVVEADARRRT